MPAPITYVIPYGLYFSTPADGIAAKIANGGTILLGGMTPAAAAAAYPLGVVVQGGAFTLFNLTGSPGPIPGAYADMTQGVSAVTSWTPTSHVLATDAVTLLTGTTPATPGFPERVEAVQVEWDGTLIFEGGGGTLPPAVGPAVPIEGKFQIQVIPYTGSGVNGRALATSFPLDVGSVAIWIFPTVNRLSCFRSNSPAMTVTIKVGGGSSATGGIMTIGAAGFTIADDPLSNLFTNTLGETYTAIIFNDTGETYMAVGIYPGRSDILTNGVFQPGSPDVVCGSFTATDIGRTFLISASPATLYTIIAIPDATHIRVSPVSSHGGLQQIFAAGGNSDIAAGRLTLPTLVWDFGRGACFADDKMAIGTSLALFSEAVSLTDEILALVPAEPAAVPPLPARFRIGTSNNVNNNALTYYWVAFRLPAGDPAESFFRTWKFLGTGAATDQVTGLGFLPTFAGVRPQSAAIVPSGWRGPWHVGASGENFDATLGVIGILGFALGSIYLDNLIAPAGREIHGWALRDGRVIIAGEAAAPDVGGDTGPLVCPIVPIPVTGCLTAPFTDAPLVLLSACPTPQPCAIGVPGQLPLPPPEEYY